MQMSNSFDGRFAHRGSRSRGSLACETCRRRKERCDGARPCGRCTQRCVADHCVFVQRPGKTTKERYRASRLQRSPPPLGQPTFRASHMSTGGGREHHHVDMANGSLPDTSSPTSGLQSRLIRDQKGRYMFIGDSANLSFLQVIRRLFGDCIGPCPFVDDPLANLMVEASPEGKPDWLNANKQREPPQVNLENAQYLIGRYLFATNCVLDLFDESELLEHLEAWCTGRWVDW